MKEGRRGKEQDKHWAPASDSMRSPPPYTHTHQEATLIGRQCAQVGLSESYMLVAHLGKQPTGGNVDPVLKREVWVPVHGRERSEPQAGDGGAAGGSSASCGC